jgi:hypothetical protein
MEVAQQHRHASLFKLEVWAFRHKPMPAARARIGAGLGAGNFDCRYNDPPCRVTMFEHGDIPSRPACVLSWALQDDRPGPSVGTGWRTKRLPGLTKHLFKGMGV